MSDPCDVSLPEPGEPVQVRLLYGDCIDRLRDLEDASVDVVICDPPAGIGFMAKAWDSFKGYEPRTARGREVEAMLGGGALLARAAEMLVGLALNEAVLELAGGQTSSEARALADDLRALSKARGLPSWARGFVVFMVDVWTEVDRVLKPGAFVCAWALPKTADLAGLAMRLAGWGLHESLLHLFGGGMNKAGCIGKQIDKARPEDPRTRVVCRWVRSTMEANGVTSKDIDDAFGFNGMAGHWAASDSNSQPITPRLDQVPKLLEVLGVDDPPPEIAAALLALNDAKGTPGEAWWRREKIGEGYRVVGDSPTRIAGYSDGAFDITAPATEAAKRWTGWHSQIAPGHEQWLIARKPSRLTYADQVQTYGCGAFNIDATRIPRGAADIEGRTAAASQGSGLGRGECYGDGEERDYAMSPSGSMPRNVVLTTGGPGCPEAGIDRQSGHQRDGVAVRRNGVSGDSTVSFGARALGSDDFSHGGSGGASRYFTRFDQKVGYYPKASDRTVRGRPDLTNRHPTHKHPDLMRWLVRLMAATAEHTGDLPAVVLDPFMGSGTTGWACVAEGVSFIGIELDPEHFEVARARILGAMGSTELAAEANAAAEPGQQLGLL